MSEEPEGTFEEQLGEFARRIEELQRSQQEIAYAQCLTRLARDQGLLSSTRPPRHSALRHFRQTVAGWRHREQAVPDQPEEGSAVIVIDEKTVVVTGEGEPL